MSGDIVSCCEMGSNRVGLSFQELANGGDWVAANLWCADKLSTESAICLSPEHVSQTTFTTHDIIVSGAQLVLHEGDTN